MADPLSISASIAGLVTLADTIFRATFRFAKAAKNVKQDVTQLASETQDLAGVLHRLSLLASALELDTSQKTLRLHHVISCRQMLLRVEKTLSKATADLGSEKSIHHVKRALKWPFSSTETKELLDEIARHKETLTLALTADSMDVLLNCLSRQKKMEGQLDSMAADIKENLEIATNIQLNDQRQRVLDFFMVANPQHSLRQCLRLRHPHTGLWLLDGEEFQQWLAVPNTRLWLTGTPGAGKTVLAGAIISEVLDLSSSTVGVAFFFCDYKDSRTHEVINILQTMASQLARQNHEAYMVLEAYYKEIQPNEGLSSDPSLWELNDIIHQMVACFEKVYMVIDGIDECGETAREVARALADIVEEQESTVSLTILRRDELPIREALQDAFVSIEIEAQKDDIRLYVATEMESRIQTGQLRLRNMALKDEILRALVNDNGGMFRWVSCQLDYLCELPRDKDRREALKSLPPTLNKTYERILDRIQSKNAAVQYLVEQCLHFIAVAEPPLTISELQEAVSIDDETLTLDSDALVDEATIIQHCSSLVRRRVSYNGADTYLEFSHFSVAEYLQGSSLCGTKLERYRTCQNSANRSLATACLRMLCLDEVSYQPTATMEDFTQVSERNWQHPFYPYAALLWPRYASNHWQDTAISDLIMRLFSPEKPTIFFSWALQMFHFLLAPRYLVVREAINAVPEDQHMDEFIQFSSVVLQKGFTPLHIAAALGLIEPCRMLVQKGADVNAMCQLGTPLHSAVSATNFFVRGTNASDFSDSDTSASSDEDLSVSSIDSLPEPDDDSELDSIYSVSEYGSDLWLLDHFKVFDYTRPQIIDLFIAGGAQLLNSPGLGQLPLFQAALVTSRRIKNLDMVTSLVKAGIVLEESDLRHFERFMRQAWRVPRNRGGEETINRLISSLAFLKDEATTSAVAAQLYPLTFDLITSLAVKGSTSGKDSLLQAVGEATEDPLAAAIVAVGYDNIEELKHILKHHNLDLGKRVNSKGETFLHIAVKHVSINSVKLMLEHGCNALVPDFQEVLPIWMCSTDIHSLVLRLLIDSNQEQLEAKDIDGNTIWHMAAKTGSCEILRALIEKTPNFQRHLEVLNFECSSALNMAMNASRVDAAALLARHHPNQVSSWTREIPLMHLAAKVGSSDLVQMLIDAGVDTKAKVEDGSTPLHHLKGNSTIQCVQLLKSLYPDLGARDSQGLRPLEAFVVNVKRSHDSYLLHQGGEKSNFLNIFNQLIPPDALTPVSNGPTFWADFWSKVGPNGHPYMFLHGTSQDWLNMIVSRLMQLGVVAAHEKTTKTSAIPVFVSVLLDNDRVRRFRLQGLAKLVKKLFDATEYPDEAVNSYELVTLLHCCIAIDDYQSTETFLKMRVDTKRKVECCSALEVACSARSDTSVELLKLLFECADAPPLSDLNTGKGGLGLIHLLGETKHRHGYERTEAFQAEQRLKFLITAGADPNLCTESGDSAVIFHLKSRRINTARLLVDLGADPTLPDSDGYDALTHAVLRGHLDFLVHVHNLERKKKLPNDIQWDKIVDITWDQRIRSWGKDMSWALERFFYDGCFRGCNALHLAALQCHDQVLEFYLKEGLIKDIEGTAEAGWTAMHFGAYRGSDSVIKLLHNWGANVDACAMAEGQNDDPWTPYRLTIRKNGQAAKALLCLGARKVETTNKREPRFLGHESDTDSEQGLGISFEMQEDRDMSTQRPLPFLPHLVAYQGEYSPERTTRSKFPAQTTRSSSPE
ncbi:Ankyrin repeat, partial [Fusarium albosuccineum]